MGQRPPDRPPKGNQAAHPGARNRRQARDVAGRTGTEARPQKPSKPEPRPPAASTPPQEPKDGSDRGQTRAETDAGRLGDKIAHPDPAAAPLQGDAEAAGTPTSAQANEDAVAEQRRTGGSAAQTQPHFGREAQPRRANTRMTWMLTSVLTGLVAIGIVAALIWS